MTDISVRKAIRLTLSARTRQAMRAGSQIVMVEVTEMATLLGIDPVAQELPQHTTAELDERGMEEARLELRCTQDTKPFMP